MLIPLNSRQASIISIIRQNERISSSKVAAFFGNDVSVVTIKRDLSFLSRAGYLMSSGDGRSVTYRTTQLGRLFAPVDAHVYGNTDTDARQGYTSFDINLFKNLPENFFESADLAALNAATSQHLEKASSLTPTLRNKENERFIIELSWKSSRIEGNTYSLLDTERLMRDGVPAPGHPPEEATMILNHKSAFAFVRDNLALFRTNLPKNAVEEVHRLLVQGLNVGQGIRRQVVGITGSSYKPLANPFQIDEAFTELSNAVARTANPFSAGLFALAGLSYLQPFEDGNKRTARLVANAVLLARGAAPLSYRSVDDVLYREATLVFYETHSLMPLKEIFKSQYLFAAEQYAI